MQLKLRFGKEHLEYVWGSDFVLYGDEDVQLGNEE